MDQMTSTDDLTGITTDMTDMYVEDDTSQASQTAEDMALMGDALAHVMEQLDTVLAGQRDAILEMVILATNTASSILANTSSRQEGATAGATNGLADLTRDLQASLAKIPSLPHENTGADTPQLKTLAANSTDGPIPEQDAAAIAIGELYQATAHAISLAMQNAVASQQQMNVLGQAALAQASALLLSLPTYAAR